VGTRTETNEPRVGHEDELPWTMAWVRRHDEYDDAAAASA
jgi:hypothetical protein